MPPAPMPESTCSLAPVGLCRCERVDCRGLPVKASHIAEMQEAPVATSRRGEGLKSSSFQGQHLDRYLQAAQKEGQPEWLIHWLDEVHELLDRQARTIAGLADLASSMRTIQDHSLNLIEANVLALSAMTKE